MKCDLKKYPYNPTKPEKAMINKDFVVLKYICVIMLINSKVFC